MMQGISRRDLLRNLAIGAAGGSVMQVIPAEAAALAHQMVQKEKASTATGKYAPKYFTQHEYDTLTTLCEMIIPKDEKSGGAVEAGAPEFIDLLASENEEYQLALGGGLMWLDHHCKDLHDCTFLQCSPVFKNAVVESIAYKKNAKTHPTLSQGVVFFAQLRQMTCDGYYTSKIGIEDLGYIGNLALADFPGCPPFPES